MFRLQLFKIRAFTAGVFASFLAAISRGGLMFLLIIWLQGIWLPLHGYSFATTPLWAGIALIPLTVGMLIAGPVSGVLSDRYGARPFATGGMIGAAICFALLEALPIDFNYWVFGVMLFFTGLAMASFGSPNRTGVMNSLPPEHRGAGSGMNTTFQNSAQVISIGIFFTLMILGLRRALPHNVLDRAAEPRRAGAVADQASHLPPISTLFAAFSGYDPIAAPDRRRDPGASGRSQQAALAQRSFFPGLIADPFRGGSHAAFDFAIAMSLAAAAASWTRGGRYVHTPADADADADSDSDAEPQRARPLPGRPGFVNSLVSGLVSSS